MVYWNVHGFKNISNELLACGAQIMLLSETWLTQAPRNLGGLWDSYHQFWIPALKQKSLGRPSGGMVLLIKKELGAVEILDVCSWWIFAKLTLNSQVIVIGGVYFSPALDLEVALDMLQAAMDQVQEKCRDCKIILGGDFNARVGVADDAPGDLFEASNLYKHRMSLDTATNKRGKVLRDFMEENAMIVINGRAEGDYPASYTFSSKVGNSVVDLVWVNIAGIECIKNLSVSGEASLSDHFAVSVQTTFQQYKPVAKETRKKPTMKKVKWNQARGSEFSETAGRSVRNEIDFQNVTVDNLYSNFCEALLESADATGMICTSSPPAQGPAHKNKTWYDTQCKDSKKRMQTVLKKCRASQFAELDRINYSKVKKEHKALLDNKKLDHENNIRDRLAGTHDPATFWEVVRSLRGRSFRPESITVEQWSLFYSTVFKPRANIDPSCHYFGVSDPFMDRDITIQEVEKALGKCKRGKAPGYDLIPNELLRALPNNWKLYLAALFNKILDTERVPKAWSMVLLTMLHKKGDREDPSNYRGIALVSCTAKLFTHILRNRIEGWEEVAKVLPESQAGFRKSRGCVDNIFALQSAIHLQLRLGNRRVFALFVDFKRAFDSVDHTLLWNKLFAYGLSAKILRILKNLYDAASLRVRAGGQLSREVEITEGVLQGEILSPLLFILFIADLEQDLRKCGLRGVNIDGTNDIMALLYADDLVILADSPADMNRKLTALSKYCQANSLTINADKTKIVQCRSGGANLDIKFFYRKTEIETVGDYTYLGVPFAGSALGLRAANSAVSKAKLASGVVTTLLQRAKSDSWDSKARLYDSIVTATLLYSAHIWGLRYAETLERAQMNFFKRLLLLPRDTPGYAIRLELDLNHISYRLLDAAWAWILRVLSMAESRLPKLCLMRLVQLHRNAQYIDNRYNWVKQIDECLVKIDFAHLWDDMSPELWESSREEAMQRYRTYLKTQDLARWHSGRSLQASLLRVLDDPRAPYLNVRVNLSVTRILAQLRLATSRGCNLSYKGMTHKLNPTELCSLCNRNEPESVEHFLFRCPIFEALRAQYLEGPPPASRGHIAGNNNILETSERCVMKAIYYYVTASLRLRAFILNE